MGYGVYWVPERNRWEGYGVPAVCDFPDCDEKIDHGIAYRCEVHREIWYDEEDREVEHEDEGCGLTLCEGHRYQSGTHFWVDPKPQAHEWIVWVLSDESWKQWRKENPDRVAEYRKTLED